MGDDEPMVPQATPWWREMMAASDARAALRTFVAARCRCSPGRVVSEVLKAAPSPTTSCAVVHDGHERLAARGFGEVVDDSRQAPAAAV